MIAIDKKGVSLELIAACSADGIIGVGPSIPWSFKKDMAYFKKITTGLPIVMGSKTARTFAQPLPNRTNFVLTSIKGSFPHENFHERQSLQEVIDWCVENDHERLMVIGGGKVYWDTLDLADVVHLNIIDKLIIGDVEDRVTFPLRFILEGVIDGTFHTPELEVFTDIDRLTQKEHEIFAYTYRRWTDDEDSAD